MNWIKTPLKIGVFFYGDTNENPLNKNFDILLCHQKLVNGKEFSNRRVPG
ncbi:hypothetical protein SAMN03080602_01991 [Arenibacter troitsensis]|uniref:Uncharacterized protein n=1 Tax=Arenibacter troitsensis TaxID=188872 RepID=A0A1X7JR24_9FLAO|nr:hypothetical protein SAMN03080602_01991 [Arenibacter troitsensis]